MDLSSFMHNEDDDCKNFDSGAFNEIVRGVIQIACEMQGDKIPVDLKINLINSTYSIFGNYTAEEILKHYRNNKF